MQALAPHRRDPATVQMLAALSLSVPSQCQVALSFYTGTSSPISPQRSLADEIASTHTLRAEGSLTRITSFLTGKAWKPASKLQMCSQAKHPCTHKKSVHVAKRSKREAPYPPPSRSPAIPLLAEIQQIHPTQESEQSRPAACFTSGARK